MLLLVGIDVKEDDSVPQPQSQPSKAGAKDGLPAA
jgi:hypothetical protein